MNKELESNETFTKNQIDIFIIINIIVLALITYASTTLTLGFFGSIGEGSVQTSNWLTGLVNDACKIFLPMLIGIAIAKKKFFLATFIVFMTVGTMGVSYMASQGLDLNNSNKVLVESSSKQELVTERDKKETELKNLLDEKTSLILGLQSEIKKLPINYPTAKKNLQQSIERTIDKYTKLITPTQGQIDTYNNKIQNYKVDVSMTVSGYHAIAKYTGMSVGDIAKYKNIFMEVLSLLLSLCLGMLLSNRSTGVFDKVANKLGSFRKNRKNPIGYKGDVDGVTAMAYDMGRPNNDFGALSTNLEVGTHSFEEYDTNHKGTGIQDKRITGFVYEKPDNTIDAEIHKDIKVYVNAVLDNPQNNAMQCLGLTSMHNITGYNRDRLRKAKDYLEHAKALYVKGTFTYINDMVKLKSYI